METNKMKQTYEAPELKVVAFQVEKGFASSLQPQSPSLDRSHGEEMSVDETNRWGTF